VDLCHAMGPWCVPGRGPWEERVAKSCAFGLAGYLSDEKEIACEGVEVAWCLVVALGRLWGFPCDGDGFDRGIVFN